MVEARGGLAERVGLRRRVLRRRRVVVATVCVLLFLALLGVMMFDSVLQQFLYPVPWLRVPAEAPPGLREERLPIAPGVEVMAWGSVGEVEAGRPAALFFHGNGENLETMRQAGLFSALGKLGVAYLAVDYPGYGRSGGKPSEESLVAAAEAALDRLRQLYPERPVVAVGWSLGAAVAMQLAARRPEEVDGVVLLSAWTDLADTAAVHFPGAIVRPLIGSRYDSLAAAPEVRGPALLVHGEDDRVIPVELGRRLAEALEARTDAPTRWVPVPRAGHNDLLARDQVWTEMRRFLEGVEQ